MILRIKYLKLKFQVNTNRVNLMLFPITSTYETVLRIS